MEEVWKSDRRRAKPAQTGEIVDLSSKFGISFHGSDSDSSDEEFEVEKAEVDSEDSHEFSGDEPVNTEQESDNESTVSMETSDKTMETDDKQASDAMETSDKPSNGEQEYNPLVVRRSNRAIKPTKDVDLYLLGAQFGIDLEGSDIDSSDPEFEGGKEGSKSGSSVSSLHSDNEGDNSNEVAAARSEVSEQSSAANQAASAALAAIPLCAVCLEDSQDDGDIVECDWCGISVHEGCYGVPEEDGVDGNRSSLSSFTTIPWFCDACKAGLAPTVCRCELCPNVGGLFKQSVNGRWVHVVCGLYTPGIEYVEPTELTGVTLDQVPAGRWGGKECQLCDDLSHSRTGVCISCDAGMCKSAFHVTCAQRYGLLCEMDSDDEEKELCDPYFAHCKAHSDKDMAKRKKRDYLTVINKQKSFVRNPSDTRIQHYLDEARKEYMAVFRKMQHYYRPELTFRSEERLLQHMPSAHYHLTRKAQLLGYETEVIGQVTETRRMVQPGLTCDFVNYFHERQSRVGTIEGESELLSRTNSELKSEEISTKEQLAAVERELGLVRSKGQQLQSQANALYLNLSRLTDKEFKLPEGLREEESEGVSTGGKERERIKCVVCEGSHDNHLMVLCDTCNNHYHIGCVDPPLSKVPKKTVRWGWECHRCVRTSEDELAPTLASFDEPSSRSGRKIQPPKSLLYPDTQVYKSTTKKKKGKSKK